MSQVDSLKNSILELNYTFKEQMAAFQAGLDRADTASPTVASLSASFGFFKEFVMKSLESLQKQVELLTGQVDQIETRSRRKMLLVHGVAEEDSEDTTQLVASTLRAIRNDFTVAEVERCHRLGGRSGRSKVSKKPRAILVKFVSTATRDDVWFGKVALKGTGVTLGEFLTKPRHSAFMVARERFGVRNCWSWNCKAQDVRR